MSVIKVIELLAQSDQSWEEATRVALREAAKTVKNIKSLYVKDMQAIVENNKIVQYRVNVKVSFTVEG